MPPFPEPLSIHAFEGAVIVEPRLRIVAITPAAAFESARLLTEAAHLAKSRAAAPPPVIVSKIGVSSEPIVVAAAAGEIMAMGPDAATHILTPDAAEETGRPLMVAARRPGRTCPRNRLFVGGRARSDPAPARLAGSPLNLIPSAVSPRWPAPFGGRSVAPPSTVLAPAPGRLF